MLAALSLFAAAADNPGGWPDLFPRLGVMYDRRIAAPVVGKGDKPEVYSQTARYEWTGGRYEVLTVTVARDPAFRAKYADEAVKNADPAPKAVEVGKKRAYQWQYPAKPGDVTAVRSRLVVVLADDKVLTLEGSGQTGGLPGWAKSFDLDRVAKALDAPPPAGR